MNDKNLQADPGLQADNGSICEGYQLPFSNPSTAPTPIPSAMVVVDADTQVLSADNVFAQMWGLADAGQALGRPLSDFFDEDQNTAYPTRDALEQSHWRGILIARRDNGETFPVMGMGIRVPAAGAGPGHVAFTLMDLSASQSGDTAASNCYESMFRAIYDHYPDPIYVMDPYGQICETNTAATKLHQAEGGGLVGRNIAELGDPVNAGKAQGRVARAAAGETLRFDSGQVLPDKTFVPLEVVLTPYDHGGERRVLGICRDVTSSLAAEKLIRKSAERPKLALESAKQGLYDLNVQTGACVVNDEYATMLGYDPETFVETNAAWIQRLHPDDLEPVKQNYLDYVSGKIKDYRVEFRQRMADGSWKWILSIGKIIEHDEQGQPLRFVGTHTDISDMKAAQQIIEKEAERYRLALASTRQGFFEANLQTGSVHVSTEYAQMLGFEPSEMPDINAAYYDRLHPDDRDAMSAKTLTLIQGQTTQSDGEFRMSTRSGEWKWIYATVSVIEHDDQGRPLRLTGTHTDITTLKKAQQVAQEDARRSQLALASTNQGFFESNLQTGSQHVSAEYARMLGYEPHEMRDIHSAWLDLLHPEDAARILPRFEDLREGRTRQVTAEFRMKTRDGRWIWVRGISSVIEYDAQGKPLRISGTHTDITEIKSEQEEALREADRPRLALSSARHALWEYDITNQVVHGNDEYALMLGYKPEGFVDTFETVCARIHPDDLDRVLNGFVSYIEGRSNAFREEFRERHRNGEWVWIQSTGKIIERDEQGTPKRLIGMRINISEMKAAEEELEQRRHALMQSERLSLANGLASVVAHELNQPLCAITNHMATIQHACSARQPDVQSIREDAQFASDAAHRAADIIRRFRRLFDKQQPVAQPCNLPELIEQCLQMIRGEIKGARIRVNLQLAEDIPTVRADPTLLQQVVINLIQNAIDAMSAVPEDRRELTITLEADRSSGTLDLRVSDTGPGFPDSAADNLFEAKQSSKSAGLGIGLCICRLIVRAHGGTIALEQTSETGSTIHIRLQAAGPDPAGPLDITDTNLALT